MSGTLDAKIVDAASFDQAWEWFKDMVHKTFMKDGGHIHLIFLIRPDGGLRILDFDKIMDGVHAAGFDEDACKDRVFGGIANLVYGTKCTGFFEITEGWGATLSPGNTTEEEAMEEYGRLKEKYGMLKNVPTRLEFLILSGRFENDVRNVTWQINRRGKEYWLKGDDENDKRSGGRIAWVHQAIDKVMEEKS